MNWPHFPCMRVAGIGHHGRRAQNLIVTDVILELFAQTVSAIRTVLLLTRDMTRLRQTHLRVPTAKQPHLVHSASANLGYGRLMGFIPRFIERDISPDLAHELLD